MENAKKCPQCGLEFEYSVDCERCGGTGVGPHGEPCTMHVDTIGTGECTPHCCRGGKRGPFSRLVGVEYAYNEPEHYDGVSEWRCPGCGLRVGRWSGKVLGENEVEPRFGRPVKS